MHSRKITLLLLVAIVSGIGGSLCAEDAKDTPAYDAELAKRLGADEYGMKNYVMVIIKTGPNDATIKGKKRDEIFGGHMANIARLADEGKLAVAGPFGKNDQQFRGLFILNVSDVEEAKKLAETDPAVRAGIFVVDLIPWYGSASLMATNEIHKKITKPGSSVR
jgi:uncharacterized protein YciI